MKPSDPVVIGVVLAPHGLHGTLRVRATGSGSHLREDVEPVVAGRRRRISHVRRTPKGFLVDLEGVEDRAAAAACTGEDLVLDRSELDVPGEGLFYVGDLVGLGPTTVAPPATRSRIFRSTCGVIRSASGNASTP